MCVAGREREQKREGGREREKERDRWSNPIVIVGGIQNSNATFKIVWEIFKNFDIYLVISPTYILIHLTWKFMFTKVTAQE
jgi:hypothetical protein